MSTTYREDKRRFGSAHLGILKLGCLDSTLNTLDTSHELIRLSGRLCGKGYVGIKEVRAHHLGKSEYLVGLHDPFTNVVSTEFFPLQNGDNNIELEIVYKNGKSGRMGFRISKNNRQPATK